MTEMVLDISELSGKQLGLLKEIVPRLSRIAIFGVPGFNAPQFAATETAARALAVEVESSPKLSRIAILWDLVTGPMQMEAVKKTADLLKIEVDVLRVRSPSDFETAFSMASQHGAGAMAILSSSLISENMPSLAELALRHHLAAITLFRRFRSGRGIVGLWAESSRCAAAGWTKERQGAPGDQARGFTDRAADQIRVGRQS
jgi:hypothetical protein